MYVCMYVCIVYVCIYVCMYVCIYVYVYVCMYVCMYSGQIAQVVEHQTADPWVAGSSLTSGRSERTVNDS